MSSNFVSLPTQPKPKSAGSPAFLDEIIDERGREHLAMGVWSGYAVPCLYGIVIAVAQYYQVIPWAPWYYGILASKLLTNSALPLALRKQRYILPVAGTNLVMDLLLMTGAVYLTGGVLSPAAPMYIAELAVIAALTNRGATLAAAVITVILFSGMVILVHLGFLPPTRPVVVLDSNVSTGYVVSAIALFGSVVLIGTVFVGMIVQQLRQSEKELKCKNAELIEASKARSQFMANITHELRTPIYGIVGLADVLDAGVYGPVSDKQHEALENVQGSARSLLELIDSLLLYARSEAGRLELRIEEVDINELLARVVASARWMIGRRNLVISEDISESLPVLHSDRGKIVHVVLNLLSNAIKFTPDGGVITIKSWVENGRLVVVVSDTGPGISPADQEKIFEAFWQADGSAERSHGGAGLGLSLVRSLVVMLAGELKVESELDKGASFTVTLPIIHPNAEEIPPESSARVRISNHGTVDKTVPTTSTFFSS